jgi:hypothetical protein
MKFNFKKYKIGALLLIVTVAASSGCKKYLDEKNRGTLLKATILPHPTRHKHL